MRSRVLGGSRRRPWVRLVLVVVVLGVEKEVVEVLREERARGGPCRVLSRGLDGYRGCRASMTLLEWVKVAGVLVWRMDQWECERR